MKIRQGFVSNSSSTAFVITNLTNEEAASSFARIFNISQLEDKNVNITVREK